MDTVDFYDASGSGPVSFFFRSVFGRALQGGEASRFLGWRSSPEFSDRALGPTVQAFGDGDGRSGGETQRIQAVNGTSSMGTCQLSEMFSNRVAIYMYNIYIL